MRQALVYVVDKTPNAWKLSDHERSIIDRARKKRWVTLSGSPSRSYVLIGMNSTVVAYDDILCNHLATSHEIQLELHNPVYTRGYLELTINILY